MRADCMREVLDLFSAAAGGWSLGMHRAGYRTLAACEVEAWRRAVYAENNPHVRLYDDVRTLTADRLLADLGRLPRYVVGSPPCQDISSANTKGKGVEGERSGLYFEAIRIIGEVRPRWFALENSANLRTRGADAVIAALEAIGYSSWACVVRAGDIGANHERPRAWLIGCDIEQVGHPDDFSGGSIASLPGGTNPLSSRGDDVDAASIGHEGWRTRRHGPDGFGTPPASGSNAGDATRDGCGSRLSGRCAVSAERLCVPAGGDAGNADREPGTARVSLAPAEGSDEFGSGRFRSDAEHGGGCALPDADTARFGIIARTGGGESLHAGRDGCLVGDDDAHGAGDAADADEARQAHGCVEPGLRSPEVADDGCGVGRGADGTRTGQMGVCAADRFAADRSGPEWSLAHLADHLRLDDGLSTWLAGQRVQIGDGKGQSAASLVVEAFGDAVIPQIPEAIGNAIARTEAALAAVYGCAA